MRKRVTWTLLLFALALALATWPGRAHDDGWTWTTVCSVETEAGTHRASFLFGDETTALVFARDAARDGFVERPTGGAAATAWPAARVWECSVFPPPATRAE